MYQRTFFALLNAALFLALPAATSPVDQQLEARADFIGEVGRRHDAQYSGIDRRIFRERFLMLAWAPAAKPIRIPTTLSPCPSPSTARAKENIVARSVWPSARPHWPLILCVLQKVVITNTANKKTASGIVADKCEGCKTNDLGMSILRFFRK
ncbi:hypothetical protein JVU11DRAFT_10209 [Chiua virens]|nr:hypothetical protein JVU11DRAFT_10209 [Chiua virens]